MEDAIHEEILREAMQADEPARGRSPLWYIGGFLLVFMMVILIVPSTIIKPDPSPTRIPSIDEVAPSIDLQNLDRPNGFDLRDFVDYNSPAIKTTATKVATTGCPSEKICQAKAIFYFVRDNFAYVAETDEYIQTPQELFYTRGGDCDDFSVTLASMQNAIGIPARFIKIPGHVYVQIYIEDAPGKYLDDGWINLDATCRTCEFGEIPYSSVKAQKSYLY